MAGAVRRPVKMDWKMRFMKYFAYLLVGGYGAACFYGLPEGWGALLALVGPVVVPFIYGLVGVLLGFPAIDVSPPNTGGGGDYDSPVDVDPLHSLKSYVNYEEFIENRHDY